MNNKIYIFTFLFFCFFISTSFALFEYKEVFANAASMSGSFSSNDDNPAVMYYNPAGLFNIPKYSLYLSNTFLYGISQLQNNTFCFSTDVKLLGRLGILYNNFGFELYKENNLIFSYANSIADKVSLGFSIKSLGVNIKNYGSKNFVSTDIGVLSKLSPKFILGFVVKDFTRPKIAEDETVDQTLVVTSRIQPISNVKTYVDVVKSSVEPIFARIGEEIKLTFSSRIISVIRFGVETVTDTKPARYAAGFGVEYSAGKTEFVFDYAYVVHTSLGAQHLFSININFGKKQEIFLEEVIPKRRARKTTYTETSRRKEKELPKKPININTATAEELSQLPGIGPSTAQKIVEYRQQIGKFTSVEQLLDIPRIGTVTLQRIKPYITLTEEVEEKEQKQPSLPSAQTIQQVEEKKVEKVLPVKEQQEQTLQKEELKPQQQIIQQPEQEKPKTPEVEKYNINLITEEELIKLGFSSTAAKNIVRYRTRFGKIKSIDELYKIPAVDKTTVEKIKDKLVIE